MSHVYLVPPLLLFLAKSPIVENYDFSHLQLILTGAAQVGKEVADEVKRRIPTVGQVAQGRRAFSASLHDTASLRLWHDGG